VTDAFVAVSSGGVALLAWTAGADLERAASSAGRGS
jgi:hypothetical protein